MTQQAQEVELRDFGYFLDQVVGQPCTNRTLVNYVVYQLEKCPTTGRTHYQFYIQMEKPVEHKKAKAMFPNSTHLDFPKGSAAENRKYASKEESRLAAGGEHGDMRGIAGGKGQGSREDLKKLKLTINEAAAMTNKRALREIGAKLPLLDDATLARLEQQVADERKRRKSDSPLATMRARLKAMEGVYSGIAESADCNWKSQATSNAIDRLHEVDLARFAADVEAMDDSGDRWVIALEYSRAVQGIVNDVDEWGGKRVNGSAGEWCPDEVGALQAMWQRLVGGARPPPPGVEAELAQLDFGDYAWDFGDFCDFGDDDEDDDGEAGGLPHPLTGIPTGWG
jgi:hypothetical protein